MSTAARVARSATVAAVAGALALTVVACSIFPIDPLPSPASNSKAPLMAEFDRNLRMWRASGIATYAFTYTPSCFCGIGPHLVVSDHGNVRIDGVGIDALARRDGAIPVGVDGLFDIVRRAIAGDRLSVTYDAATGVPTSMDSDPVANAIDDELSFAVTGWTLDPPDDRVLGRITIARRVWDRAAVQDYDWAFRVACACADDGRRFDVTVRNGEVTTVRSGGKRIKFDPIDPVEPFSVTRLLDNVASGATTVETTIDFDSTFGYPTHVEMHDDRPDALRAWSLRVLSFEVARG
jgi:Family of unknown function (DUF6174)